MLKKNIALALGFCVLLQPASVFSVTVKPQTPPNQFGIYLNAQNAGNEEFATLVIDRLSARGMSALVFDVKAEYVYFHSTGSSIADESGLVISLYDLHDIVTQAKEKGIYTIARYVAVKDMMLGSVYPETRLADPETGEKLDTEWVEPANETVLEYNRQLITEVARSGVDEINLDYIRYPSDNLSSLNKLSTAEKVVNIEAFVRMARRAIDSVGMDTKLGISTFAILGWNYEDNIRTLGQDVVRFAPFVDIISPMAYPQTFSEAGGYFVPGQNPRSREYWIVYRTLEGYKELLGEHAWKLRPWIQGYFVDASAMVDQIEAVYDAGLCGFTVWSAGNYYQPLYQAMHQVRDTPSPCQETMQVVENIE